MSKESIAAIPSVASKLATFEANPNYTDVHNPYICYNGGTGTGFEIAGADGTYVTATSAIQDDGTVLVSASSVAAPKNARYC